jgi:hypothetical protein
MRELKGEMREFKEHAINRLEKLEMRESERVREKLALAGVLISGAALAISAAVNFFMRRQ